MPRCYAGIRGQSRGCYSTKAYAMQREFMARLGGFHYDTRLPLCLADQPVVPQINSSVMRDLSHYRAQSTTASITPWTEPSMRLVSLSQVRLVVGKKRNPWTTHPVTDLALEVAGGWWTRFTQIPFRLQLLNMSYYCWLARGSPISSVSHKCFQFRRCNAALIQCGL